MAKGVKLFMGLFKTSKAILLLAWIIYSMRKSTSMGQTFTNQCYGKEKKREAQKVRLHARGVRMIYDASMLISRPPLHPEKQCFRQGKGLYRYYQIDANCKFIYNLFPDDFPRYILNSATSNVFSIHSIPSLFVLNLNSKFICIHLIDNAFLSGLV